MHVSLMLGVRGLDVTFIREYRTKRCIENICDELVFTACFFDLSRPYVLLSVWASFQKIKQQLREKKKETQTDSGLLLFLHEDDQAELQPVIDFRNCSARVVSLDTRSTTGCDSTAWEAPAPPTGPVPRCAARRPVRTQSCPHLSSFRWRGSRQPIGESGASRLILTSSKFILRADGRMRNVACFPPDQRTRPVFHCVPSGRKGGVGFRWSWSTRKAHLFPDFFSQQLLRRLNEFG